MYVRTGIDDKPFIHLTIVRVWRSVLELRDSLGIFIPLHMRQLQLHIQ